MLGVILREMDRWASGAMREEDPKDGESSPESNTARKGMQIESKRLELWASRSRSARWTVTEGLGSVRGVCHRA